MANRHRGEIEAVLGGERRVLVLTLGALAELEDAFGGEDMLALATRFEAGRIDDAAYRREARTFMGVGLRPLSPVHVRAVRKAGGDIALSRVRRTRVGGDGWEGIDVPLGEEEEHYEVDILSGARVVRTLGAGAPVAIYAAADQSVDFGGISFSTLAVRVAQVSRAFGRGISREAILNV